MTEGKPRPRLVLEDVQNWAIFGVNISKYPSTMEHSTLEYFGTWRQNENCELEHDLTDYFSRNIHCCYFC